MTLLQMTFASNVFKIFETPTSKIMRFEAIQNIELPVGGSLPPGAALSAANIGVLCKCGTQIKIHAPFQPGLPVPIGALPLPADNRLKCPVCGVEHDLADARRQVEAQAGRPIVSSPRAPNAAV